jgi:hypothetical protein
VKSVHFEIVLRVVWQNERQVMSRLGGPVWWQIERPVRLQVYSQVMRQVYGQVKSQIAEAGV